MSDQRSACFLLVCLRFLFLLSLWWIAQETHFLQFVFHSIPLFHLKILCCFWNILWLYPLSHLLHCFHSFCLVTTFSFTFMVCLSVEEKQRDVDGVFEEKRVFLILYELFYFPSMSVIGGELYYLGSNVRNTRETERVLWTLACSDFSSVS